MVLEILGLNRKQFLEPLGLDYQNPLFELVDIIIMSLAIGYLFSAYLKKPVKHDYDPLDNKSNNWENIKYAAVAAAPAVVLHELAHKFVAMAFGATATLYAPYGFYLLVIILRMLNFPLFFFVGGYVEHTGLLPLESAAVAISGIAINFLLYSIITILLKKNKLNHKYYPVAIPLARISLYLAIFNLLPIPGFDGFNFIMAILASFGA